MKFSTLIKALFKFFRIWDPTVTIRKIDRVVEERKKKPPNLLFIDEAEMVDL